MPRLKKGAANGGEAKMQLGGWIVLGLGIGAAALSGLSAKEDQTNVSDPYIWLEDVHGEKPLAWVKEQNAHALGSLQADPDYKSNYDTLLAFLDANDRIPYGSLNHQYVFNLWQDAQNPKGIWRRTTIADYANASPQWEPLLDIDKLSKDEHESWVFKGSACTPTLTRCLVSLSRGGGDAVVVREFDLASKSFVKGGFTLPEAKSDIAFIDDNTVLFGTDFGKGSLTTSGYPRIVKIWHRGEAVADARIVLEGKPEDVAVSPGVLRNGDVSVPVIVRTPSFFETEYHLQGEGGAWSKLAVPSSAVLQGLVNGQLIFTLRADWVQGSDTITKGSLIALNAGLPGEIVSVEGTRSPVSPNMPEKLQTIVGIGTPTKSVFVLFSPGPRASVEEVSTGRDAVYASIFDNVVGSIHAFRFDASKQAWSDAKLDLPPAGATHVVSTNDFGSEAQFRFESFLTPNTLYADDGSDHPRAIKSAPARFDSTGLTTEQHEAVSTDGVKIPYFVVRKAGATGPQPTILYGYGGFEISQTPHYWESMGKLWLTRGGALAVANIRGGGEFGPAWHDAALKTNRQKAFDDFAAVAADLSKRGITSPKQLGIMGGSNGGLLVSTVMTQHPELLGAVVCQVPLIDMIRYTHIGAGASWIAEYGDPADPTMRDAILKYSPYQNVAKSKKYAPVFFVTATSDDRVTPVHARKMAARMIEQGHDVLFFENLEGGHAAAADHRQAAEMWALTFVYLKRELGLGK